MADFATIVEMFQSVDPPMRLELLLDYAQKLPPLPEAYVPLREAGMNRVHECQAPVFLMTEVKDGTVRLHADVPPEAPTARGFTSLLIEAFDGAAPSDVRAAPANALHELGLTGLLGMQRTCGMGAIYQRIKNEVARQTASPQDATG